MPIDECPSTNAVTNAHRRMLVDECPSTNAVDECSLMNAHRRMLIDERARWFHASPQWQRLVA
jgi:hypothetical protein